VGRANGDNRIAILIPCHRIVEGNGSLRGYGGGLWRKQFLLELERAVGRDGKGVRPLFPGEKGA
jgi:O6-methylguanine-DNA--protein-cysteine methyltransferase